MLTYQMGMSDSSWNSLNNILTASIESMQPSGFFPAPQRDRVISEIVEPAGNIAGQVRTLAPENQSMIETNYWASLNWLGSPYEDELAVSTKVQESKQLAASVSTGTEKIESSLDWALGMTKQIKTLYDQVKESFSRRETIVEIPRAGSPEGTDVAHTNDWSSRSAEVIAAGKQLYEQVKGLFGLGYPQEKTQTVSQMKTEIAALSGLSLGTVAIIILLIWFLVRK